MSGYLRRLVDTASGGIATVRPQTGSIFSPRLEESAPPLKGRAETEHLTTAPSPPDAGASLSLEAPEPPRRDTPYSRHVPLLPGSVAAQSDGLPHAPQGRREPHVEPVDPFVASAEAPAEPPRRPAPAETGFHAAATESAARGAGEGFRPLLKPARAPDAVAGAAGASRELPGQRHAARAVQQPDDIQIHIGRIEVTAVPPPAPRAPKAPDRSVSLDAYLNRRTGRAR